MLSAGGGDGKVLIWGKRNLGDNTVTSVTHKQDQRQGEGGAGLQARAGRGKSALTFS